MPGKLTYWVANWSLSRAHAALILGGPVGDLVDCTSSALEKVRETLTAVNGARRIAGYVTGTPDIRWTPQDFASIPPNCAFLRIDQSNADTPLLADARRVVKDEEPGASTIATAALVAEQRIRAGEDELIYCDAADLPGIEHAVADRGLAPGRIVAIQYASPTSNPDTLLPGTRLTLAEANADLSVILESFLPLPDLHPAPAPEPKPTPRPPTPAPAPPPGNRVFQVGFSDGYHSGFDKGYEDGFDAGRKSS